MMRILIDYLAVRPLWAITFIAVETTWIWCLVKVVMWLIGILA